MVISPQMSPGKELPYILFNLKCLVSIVIPSLGPRKETALLICGRLLILRKTWQDRRLEFNGLLLVAETLASFLNAPSSMNDFRPISFCNTTYKCITKIVASRLKTVLPDLISPSQSTFVPGRKIGDNILIAKELFRNYHRSTSPAK